MPHAILKKFPEIILFTEKYIHLDTAMIYGIRSDTHDLGMEASGAEAVAYGAADFRTATG